jgi:hypothetical protein
MKFSIFAAVALATVASVSAECPNACSGHGTCGANDMCSCYRNWQAADCSERTCPYGWSFTTTPQGDLNMDGDRFDSTMRPIVFKTDNANGASAGDPILASIVKLSDQLVFNSAIEPGDLGVGDCLVVTYKVGSGGVTTETPKYFCISAVSSSSPTTTFTLDADNDEANDISDAVVYRYLQDMPNPSGTWESWPGYATTKWQDDGHFYMECSNAGACDRSDGSCLCFPGYTGLACSRTTCPLDCSGHGTCMSVRDLAVKAPNKVSVTGSATMGSTWVPTTTSPIGVVANGDRVFIGEQATYDPANLHTVGTVSTSGFYISPPARVSQPFGSSIFHAAAYNLWDADKNQGCLCDPGYTGYACDELVCPHGADPLDMRGEDFNQSTSTASVASYYDKRSESQTLALDSSCGTVSGTFTLTTTDQVTGEKVTTVPIQANPQLSSTVTVSEPDATDARFCEASFTSVHTSAPQTAFTGTVLNVGALAGCIKLVTFEPHLPTYEIDVGDFIRVGQEYREIGACTQDDTSGNYSSCYVTERFNSGYAAGTLAFRRNARQVIDSALTNMANGGLPEADVARRVPGTELPATFNVVNDAVLGTYVALMDAATGSNPTSVAANEICVGDIIATNNHDLSPASQIRTGAQQYARQVLSTHNKVMLHFDGSTTSYVTHQGSVVSLAHTKNCGASSCTLTSSAPWESSKGAAGYHGLVVGEYNTFHKGAVKDTSVAPQIPDIAGVWQPETSDKGLNNDNEAGIMRASGGMYEIHTGIDGDPSELVCDNSGLRAVYVASSAGYVSRDEPQIVKFVDHTFGSNQPTLKALSVVGGHEEGHPEALSNGDVLFVGEQKCTVTEVDSSGDSMISIYDKTVSRVGVIGWVKCAETLVAGPASTDTAIAVNQPVEIIIGGATTSCHSTDMRALRWQGETDRSLTTMASITTDNGQSRKVTAATPNKPFLDYGDLSIGDRVMVAVGGGLYETRTIDSIAADYTYFTVSKAFSAAVSTAAADNYAVYIVGKGSKSHTECSGRGLCDDTLGECACFRGYTDAACSEQSALAA